MNVGQLLEVIPGIVSIVLLLVGTQRIMVCNWPLNCDKHKQCQNWPKFRVLFLISRIQFQNKFKNLLIILLLFKNIFRRVHTNVPHARPLFSPSAEIQLFKYWKPW